MGAEIIEAVYEHGSFHPTAPMNTNLAEGQKVRLVVEQIGQPEDVLALAAEVYEGLSDEQIDSIERHSRRREKFFEERPQD